MTTQCHGASYDLVEPVVSDELAAEAQGAGGGGGRGQHWSGRGRNQGAQAQCSEQNGIGSELHLCLAVCREQIEHDLFFSFRDFFSAS